MREKSTRRGRHPRQALTARQVQTAKGNGHTQRLADGAGLYLLIAPSGSKSWVLRVVVADKRRDIGLGGTAVLSLAEAREDAQRLRKIARAGGDPLAARRQERRSVPTFRTAAEAVHASLVPSFKNAKHGKQWLAPLAPILAGFGDKLVDSVTTDDVMGALSPR
jgi:Arm DNA-binding domain